MIQRMRALASRRFARNTAHLFAGQGGKVLLQGAYFAVIARALGVEGFGAFAAVVALAAIIAPFGSLGAQQLMVRHIVAKPGSEAVQFSTALLLTTIAGLLMVAGLVAAAPVFAPPGVDWWIIGLVACAELLGARIVDLAGSVWIAREEMRRTGGYQIEINAVRLFGAIGLVLLPGGFTLQSWAILYSIVSLTVAGSIVARVWFRFGVATPRLSQWVSEWRDGLMFSFGLASQSVYNDIDKAMLGRMSTLDATGIYTAAYRVIDMAYTPLRSLMGAAYPRFFREGELGLRPALRVARKVAVPGVGYSILAAALLVVCAPLVPLILGSDYEASVDAIRALSLIPIIRIVHYLAADALTGARHQGWRSFVQLTIAGVNVGLNFWLIPELGYWGAVVASLLTDGLLAVLLWIVVAAILRRDRTGAEYPKQRAASRAR